MNQAEYDVVSKVIGWFESQATHNSEKATPCRFETLKTAYIDDARNYRKIADDLRKIAVIRDENQIRQEARQELIREIEGIGLQKKDVPAVYADFREGEIHLTSQEWQQLKEQRGR